MLTSANAEEFGGKFKIGNLMKTTQRTLLLTFLLFLGLMANRYCSAQTQTLLTAPDALVEMVLLQPEEIPVCGTFYLLSDLAQIPAGAPPYPCVPPKAASAPVYQVEDNLFVVDDLVANQSVFESASVNSITEELEEQIQTLVQSVRTARANHAMSLALYGTEFTSLSEGGEVPSAAMYSENDLWLSIEDAHDGFTEITLHGAQEGNVYQLSSCSDLASGIWLPENALHTITNQNWISTIVPTWGGTNYLFFRARTWNETTPLGVPQWWLFEQFGMTNVPEGFNETALLSAYQNGTEPNPIYFSIAVTNHYSASGFAILQLNVKQGLPFSMAVLLDDTNTVADWRSFTSAPTIDLGTNEGWHDVWIGLRGRTESSKASWRKAKIKLDVTPPPILIRSPANNVVTQPTIQLQGYSPEWLVSISCDLTNAAGVFSNQMIFILDRHFEKSAWEYTTNTFQAYDLELTNGVNIFTIRAEDKAGNVTTTNFSFMLDYSAKTNAPVLSVCWPQNGDALSGSSFVLDGQVDDATASVTVQTLDAAGTTNTFEALVGRDGRFWVYDLPLNPGTNSLTLNAVDVLGNTSSTNLNVVQSSVILTIDPVSAGQRTVTGTISAPNHTVWVNGVVATQNGDGTWTAQIKPIGARGGSIEATAVPNN